VKRMKKTQANVFIIIFIWKICFYSEEKQGKMLQYDILEKTLHLNWQNGWVYEKSRLIYILRNFQIDRVSC
jgi:hypothetical protein